jgi:heme A synthase
MLITLLVGLIVIALIYWALTYLPLPPVVRQIGVVLLVVLGALWLLGIATGHQIVRL